MEGREPYLYKDLYNLYKEETLQFADLSSSGKLVHKYGTLY